MNNLPDPRRSAASTNALANLAADDSRRAALAVAIVDALASGDDAAIHEALRAASTPGAYRSLHDVIATAVDQAGAEAGGIAVRYFAMPLVIVAGARRNGVIPGVINEIDALRSALEKSGAVGATRNFGLSNALCDSASLERLSPSQLYRLSGDLAPANLDLPPADIQVAAGREHVHLRFITGAGLTPRNAPSFLETASNIGAWGMAVTQELTRVLRPSGIELLPLPRPPVSLLRAPHAGRQAQLELAYSLFLSNTARDFRATVGDPSAILSAHVVADGGAEIRVSLNCTLDETLLEGYVWPLHPLDDLAEVQQLLTGMLAECRISDIRVLPRVVGAEEMTGRPPFLRVGDFDRYATGRH